MLIHDKISRVITLLLLSSLALYTGCSDDNGNKTGTQLISFGPSGVLHGEDISIIGEGLDKVTSIMMPVGVEVPKSAFKSQTSTLIVLTVPEETTDGKITLKTPQGDIESKTAFGLDYTIVFTSMNEEAKPGTNITITGKYLDYVKAVQFFNGVITDQFVSQTLTELVVTVPMEAQTGKIVLSDGKLKPQLVESENKLIVTLPTVTGLEPANVKHSDNLTITGTDLDLVSEIDFNGGDVVQASSFVSQSVTQIIVSVPNKTKDGALTLKVPSTLEVVTSQQITIILPQATALSSSTPNTDMTITGTDLDLVKSVIFPDGTEVSTFKNQSPTSIVVTIPSTAVGGTLKFKTIHDFITPVAVPFGDQSKLLYTVYDDALKNNWQYWGWGGPADLASTDQVTEGTKSIKKTYANGYEGTQIGGGSIAVSSYTSFAVSLYGGAGTDGKNLRLVINGGYGAGQYAVLTLQEGKWTNFSVTFDQVNNPTTITEIVLQSEFAGDVYIDKMGLK